MHTHTHKNTPIKTVDTVGTQYAPVLHALAHWHVMRHSPRPSVASRVKDTNVINNLRRQLQQAVVSAVICHVSHVACHMSRVTCHMSHVTRQRLRGQCGALLGGGR